VLTGINDTTVTVDTAVALIEVIEVVVDVTVGVRTRQPQAVDIADMALGPRSRQVNINRRYKNVNIT
jgi:hypothetical protein